MRRSVFVAGTLLILPLTTIGQSASTDSQTLQALLAEVRQLRQELRTTSVNAQRAQILIYRVQAQQSVVTRLTQRVDTERSRLSQLQSEQKSFTSALKRAENSLSAKTDRERKDLEDQMGQMQSRLEQLSANEQDAVTRKMQAEVELRIEQSKLTQLQEALDRIDTDLARATAPSSVAPQ